MSYKKELEEWYCRQRPYRLDLVGDYAGNSRFLIHGDSLLHHCFSDPRIDFSDGFQLVHAVYIVEQFLQGLVRRRCIFDIVFLDKDARLCLPRGTGAAENSEKWLCARAIIMTHLMRLKGEHGEIRRFEGLRDGDFVTWIKDRRPLFVMAVDGEDLSAESGTEDTDVEDNEVIESENEESENEDADDEESDEEHYQLGEFLDEGEGGGVEDVDEDEDGTCEVEEWHFRALILRLMCLQDGYNIVLISDAEFRDSKIFANIIESPDSIALTRMYRKILPDYLFGGCNKNLSKIPIPTFTLPILAEMPSFRDRLTLSALLWNLSEDDFSDDAIELASIHILHTALIKHLTLGDRQWDRHSTEPGIYTKTVFFRQFLERSTLILVNNPSSLGLGDSEAAGDLCDFIDGRLLLRIFTTRWDADEVLSKVNDEYEYLAQALENSCRALGKEIKISLEDATVGKERSKESDLYRLGLNWGVKQSSPLEAHSILPFSNPIFDPYLQTIQLEVDVFDNDSSDEENSNLDVYTERTHWHNAKKPLTYVTQKNPGLLPPRPQPTGKGQPQATRWEKRQMGKQNRSEQFQSSRMLRYAASLTDSIDGGLDPKLILCESKGDILRKPKENMKKENIKKVQKNKPLSKAEIIRAQNTTKVVSKEVAALRNGWQSVCKELDITLSSETKLSKLDIHAKKIQKLLSKDAPDTHEGRIIQFEIRVYKIWILHQMWAEQCKDINTKSTGFPIVAALFDEARRAMVSPALSTTASKYFKNVFSGLGIEMPPTMGQPLVKRDLSFQTSWDGTSKENVEIGMSSERFQLLCCGQYMDRNMDSKPDPRVPFEPDGWQRKVLDEIDSNNSVFVVAPTSAGKTFISFHAMENVLKANDDGILVYVAPTKALVNQIAAEVISRFRKNYKYSGKTVWAIHTRDYRINNPSECQVLITVPHILAIMLLSPSNAERWSPRVKRIIFDEIHSIGNAEDGLIWEQLILLAPCPIIALSATVGNPKEFNSWLQSIQKSHGFKLSMIQHFHRYSDLTKYTYRPPLSCLGKTPPPFKGLQSTHPFKQLENTNGFKRIHPITSLVEVRNGIPEDLAMEPRDCLQLYECMTWVATKDFPVPKALDYRTQFGISGKVIKKIDLLGWEASLKALLKKWMDDENSPFQKLLKTLEVKIRSKDTLGSVKTEKSSNMSLKGEKKSTPSLLFNERGYLSRATLPLLNSLNSNEALPAILFSYDRYLCEHICRALCLQLKEGEKEWRKADVTWKATFQGWEKWVKMRSSRVAKKPRKIIIEIGETKEDAIRSELEGRSGSIYDSFNPYDPSPGFTFADTSKHSKSELNEDIGDLFNISPMLKEGLRRGIGVHHAGMNLRYRQCVETLFRKGYLRVVISTGTLALGINMPCKTVVFAGDSVYLTALNYRQAAGRAGRRGFDLIGNVIFHGMTRSKIQRLIGSRLPSLMGHFPISVSLVLRLFILLHNSNQSEHAKKSIQSLLTQPRLVMGGEFYKEKVLHHLRFSIEFLRRQSLLSRNGTPLNFAGLTTHLYHTETSALAFHALLCSPYFRKLCKDIQNVNSQKKICREIMLVIAHLFGRRPVWRGNKRCTLPQLPKDAKIILLKHNKNTLETYSAYMETFAQQYRGTSDNPDNILPFSKQTCGGSKSQIPDQPVGNIARSNFVSLSGHKGSFKTMDELTKCVRSDIFLEGAAVPHFNLLKTGNNYLYSFYKDGDSVKLVRNNGLRKGDVWFLLKDFSLILATIVAALVSYCKYGPGMYFDVKEGGDVNEDGDEIKDDEEDEEDEDRVDGEDLPVTPKSKQFTKVLIGFRLVQKEFEEKFRAMFA